MLRGSPFDHHMRLVPRLPVPALAALGLVLAGLALVPGTAAASCGDYVAVLGHADSELPKLVGVAPEDARIDRADDDCGGPTRPRGIRNARHG